jgi:rfaE bifunctional protein kinase chain/domain
MLLAQLDEAGIDRRGVVSDPSRPTTTKTRIVAESTLRVPQHLVRLDHLERRPVSLAIERVLGQHIAALAAQSDAVLVSHYRTGVVTSGLVEAVRGVARQYSALTVADAQADLRRFAGFDLVKCNRAEAEAELGRPLTDDVNFEAALGELLPRLGVARLAITRGAEGMSLLERGGTVIHAPASRVSDVYDVTGAGDTVVAVLTLALVAGIDLGTAARLANAAAGLVVRRLGNAVVTPAELVEALRSEEGKTR